MAYIGQKPLQEFSSIPTKDTFTGDGSTTTFDLANDVVRGGENSLEVFVNNVRQEPGTGKAFVLGIDGSSNYRRITFSSAPANGAAIYVINDKTNLTTIAPVQTDFNGVEIVLDADSDTTLHAETDDQVDLRIAGVDVLKFLQSSGDAVLKPMVDAKDIIFQQFDGNKIFEINDGNFVGVGGNATAPGEIRIFEDSDNGTNYSGFKAAASTTSSVAYQLPAADGSANTQLTTNGSGVLSWSAGITIANDSNNRITTATGSSGLNGEASLTFDGTTLAVTGNQTVSGTLGVTGVLTGTSLDISGAIDVDGTSNLDVVDIDGAVDMASTLQVDGAITGSSTIQGTTITATTAFVPDASDGAALGTTALEFSDLFLADGAVIGLGDDQEVTLTHVADTGLTLNSTNKLMFNDASQFIQGTSATVLSIGATDEIDLTATTVDLNGTLNVSGVATFQAAPVFPDGSLAVADLDIDGATDIGAAIVDADLFIVDDGAGGTNRKVTASRIKTYVGVNEPSFRAYMNGNQVIGNSSATTIVFNAETHDTDNGFNTSNYTFTVPSGQGGKYYFTMKFTFENTADFRQVGYFVVDGSDSRGLQTDHDTQDNGFIQTALIDCSAGTTVKCTVFQDQGGNQTLLGNAVFSEFSGFKLL